MIDIIREVGLVGWNGMSNVGDDAMTSVIIRAGVQQSSLKKIKIWGDQKTLPTFDVPAHIEIEGLRHYNQFIQLKGFRKWLLPAAYIGRFTSNLDLLLIGGGSLFHSTQSSILFRKIIQSARTQNHKLKVGALGVSIGPFMTSRDREATKACLEQLEFISVRDQSSLVLLEQMKVNVPSRLAPDLALAFSTEPRSKKKQTKDLKIGLSLRSGAVDEGLLIRIRDFILLIGETKATIELVLFCFSGLTKEADQVENEKLVKLLKKNSIVKLIIVPYTNNTDRFYQDVGTCDVMLCMRLHASIISYAMNVPFLIIPYHRKCLDFGELVFGASMDDYILFQDESPEDWKLKFNELFQRPISQVFARRDLHLKQSENHLESVFS